MPTIDVIVPCYNYGRYLRSCVDSVLGQHGCEIRILIIDDASTDDSLAIARSIAAADARVRVLAHERNRGHIATYNEGIEWLSADYMLLLSSDDMLAPGAFARALTLMEADRSIGFVYGTSVRFAVEADIAAASDRIGRACQAAASVDDGIVLIRRLCSDPVNRIETATAVVRTSLQKRVGGYRPEIPHSGDMEMWLRLAAQGKVGFVPAVQAFTRIHANNMHFSYKANRDLEDFRQRRLVFRTFFAEAGRDLDERRALEANAYLSLAEEMLWAAARAFDEDDRGVAVQLANEARSICPDIIGSALWWKVLTRRAVGSTLLFRAARRLIGAPSRRLSAEPRSS
jgi:glycosyltransferase involved in cell wall biosynthesis